MPVVGTLHAWGTVGTLARTLTDLGLLNFVLQTARLMLATAPFCTFLVALRVAALFGCCPAVGRPECVAGTLTAAQRSTLLHSLNPPQPVSANHVPAFLPWRRAVTVWELHPSFAHCCCCVWPGTGLLFKLLLKTGLGVLFKTDLLLLVQEPT